MKGEKMQTEKERSKLVSKTKRGVITKLYGAQVSHSKARNVEGPTYTKKWFFDWLTSQPEFHRLFHIWVINDYDKWSKPSVDRKDELLGYTEYNIELVTWEQNHFKETARQSKEVFQFSLEGFLIAKFESISKASKKTSIPSANILRACYKPEARTAGGYKWQFKNKGGDNA